MTVALVGLAVLAVVLAVALAVTVALLRRERAQRVEAQARAAQLDADLSAALRPRPAATTAERAVARVVRTASKVREQGLGGLLQSSLDDLTTWASAEQQRIASGMADAEGRVTLLFSDIEESTSLNERLGDAAWVRVLGAHDLLVRARVDRYRGEVVKTAGDGFMVAFRDAEAACRAAVGVQKDLRRSLDPRLRSLPVRVRIGVHTGTAISRDGDYFGRNVAIAARVAALATGGEVLATSEVRDALDEDAAVELVTMGEVELKGLPGRYEVLRVVTR